MKTFIYKLGDITIATSTECLNDKGEVIGYNVKLFGGETENVHLKPNFRPDEKDAKEMFLSFLVDQFVCLRLPMDARKHVQKLPLNVVDVPDVEVETEVIGVS